MTIGRLVADAVHGAEGTGSDQHLVVLPEASMHDFGAADAPLGRTAQPLDGRFVAMLAQLAVRYRLTIVAGMFETSPDESRPYNTLVVLGPTGELVASYRKLHLYDSFGYRESDRLLAGDGSPVVVTVGGFRLGLLTCYDLRFPELSRLLVEAGADVLVVPAAWVKGPLKESHWETLLRARAIENTVYVLGAAQCGRSYIGRSMAVDPMGVVLAGLGVDEGVAVTTLERRVIEQARERNPSLANRRLSSSQPPGS
jgi:predicted amidohydrolase